MHHWVEKANRYTSTEALQLAERGIEYDWRGALRFMVHDLWEHYELNDARLDGERGWILTWCAAQYRWLSVAKLIDLGLSSESAGGPSSVPADLDEFLRALEQELASFRTARPSIPLGIVWRAPIWEDSPASAESRHCVLELARSKRLVTLEEFPGGTTASIRPDTRVLLSSLERCRRSRCVLTVTQWAEFIVPPDPCACHNVLRLPARVSIPPKLMCHISAYDELWVESQEQKIALRQDGAAPESIIVVPSLSETNGSISQANGPEGNRLERLVKTVEARIQPRAAALPEAGQVRLVLEGEFFAGHSFSNINEELARRLCVEPSVALSVHRVKYQPSHERRVPRSYELASYFSRSLDPGAHVTIRHAFPPNWNRPIAGKWVHIQPWEFGCLPNDWIGPLRNEVDEVWAMSRYVEQVYLDSGVAAKKLRYIPWGIDPEVFRPDVPARRLSTDKTFRFLYVGGTIHRKGFDRVLAAYLAEFTYADDVCLVVKDMGTRTFYGPQTMQAEIRAAQQVPNGPSIVYLDDELTGGQLASLYAACHCLVAPYRGEGFGLPVLEALACGVPPIVPRGGPTDDFVDPASAFILPSVIVPAEGVVNLCGPATEFHVTLEDLRACMRRAYCDRENSRILGMAGSVRVRTEFSWDRTVALILDRVHALAGSTHRAQTPAIPQSGSAVWTAPAVGTFLGTFVHAAQSAEALVETLARIRPYVDTVVVQVDDGDTRVPSVAREYGAMPFKSGGEPHTASPGWWLTLRAGDYLDEEDLVSLRLWLLELPGSVQQVKIEVPFCEASSSRDISTAKASLFRLRDLAELEEFMARLKNADDLEIASHTVTAPFRLRQKSSVPLRTTAKTRHQPSMSGDDRVSIDQAASAERVPEVVPTMCEPPAGLSRCTYGRLRKSLLVQMANGPHLELLQLTGDRHRAYAKRHGLDYWCVEGNPAFGKRPGWGKVPLLLAGISMGYESVVWLDADAVIVCPDINLATLVNTGIGMVRHPHPQHWNTGLIVARASAAVESFCQRLDAAPENDSAWMEQAAANSMAAWSEFAGLFTELDLRYNCVPGFAMVSDPVVIAAHGMPHSQRLAVLTEALSGHYSQRGATAIRRLSHRNEFGDLLNRCDLTGEAVEVGVGHGEFSVALLKRWRGHLLHLVDPWRHLPDYIDIANVSNAEHEETFRAAQRILLPFKGRFRIHRTVSEQAAPCFLDGTFDFVYLDANHAFDSVWNDLHRWYPKLKSGGVLAGHDFLDGELPEGKFGVASAVGAFERATGLRVQLTDDPPWRSWYVFKP